jgi:LPXTG-motif cell wall-anchored protein
VTGDTTYYAVWATGNANATFYIALDGVPRNEPRVVDDGGADNGYFTSGVTIAKALKVAKFYANSAGVDDNLNAQPTAKQLYDMVSDALTNKKTILVGGVQITSVELSEDKQKLLITGANDSNLIGQELYVIWYVTKYATAGSILSGYTSTNWHVDGVLLTKGKVTLYYDAGAPSGSVKNLPDGAQYDKDTEGVVVGSDRGNNTKVLEPTRTGYNFAGWKMYTMDENGEFTVFVDDYNTEDTFTITEDTCLVAQWTRGTNFLTATKTNTEGTPLKGAKFTLESRQDADSEWVAVGTEQTSNENGVFTFSGLENFTIYCLTESYAPNGYETRNSVCFSVQTDEHDALQLFICDEYGNPLSEDKVPSWIKKGYAATDSTGNGLAQLTITIADEAIEQEVNFVKQDDAGKPLADVGFELYDENGTKLLGTATSDANGKFNFSNLKDGKLAYGTYVLKETNTSAGFAAAPDITFTINDPAGNDKGLVVSGDRSDVSVKAETVKYIDRNDNVDTTRYSYTVTITNTFSPEVKVLKASSDGNQPLSGAEFDLYRVVDDEETKIETNSPLVSGEDGMLSLGNLSNGTYKLVETKAPAGYNLLSEAVIITVHKNSHGVTATGTGPVTKNEDGSIYTITVYNSTGKELPHTGGSGTYLYTFGGLAILAVGCVYGFSMRRKRERGVE